MDTPVLSCVDVDQTKAFAMINRDYLFAVLYRNVVFLKWIRALDQGMGSHVIVNNCLEEKLSLQRGVRQGCALSTMLYVPSADPLSL